jgi:DNA polymerase III delta prime subunit
MEKEPSCLLENQAEFEKVCASVRSGYSVLILGEAGTGINDFAHALYEELLGEFSTAIAIYKGSLKNFFKAIAFQLDIPTENEEGKQLTVDLLKEEIAVNCSEETLLILPEAKRLTTSIRYWLEDLMAMGVTLVCLAAANPGKDIFLEMSEVELELPSDRHIREVMEAEAKKAGLTLSNSQLAALQPLAGRNPMLARKVIRNEKHGLNKMPEHTQYVVIMPVIIAALFAFAVVRFVGMGTGNKGLYITGGVALVSAMALKQLGNVRGARKRLGG